MKTFYMVVAACLLVGCQSDKAVNAKADGDKPATENKVRKDSDRDRRTQAIQEQWRDQVQH